MNDFMVLTIARQRDTELQLAAQRRRLLAEIKANNQRARVTPGRWHRAWTRTFHQAPALHGSTPWAEAIVQVPGPRGQGQAWQDWMMQTPQASARMIGRDDELRALNDSYGLAAAGSPQAVVIGGEAGLGKTRLLHEFVAGVPAETRIITGQCVDLGQLAPPYAPITAVLRSLATQVGLEAVVDFAGPGGDALSLLLPEIGPGPGGRPNGNRILEVVATILEHASATQPTVVVIEDLHWADDATLAVLRFILRAFGGGKFLLALTYRSDDVGRGHPLRDFLSEVERGRFAKNIRLGRLDKDHVRSQIEAITGRMASYGLVENVYMRSDGIPFFVEELLGLGDVEAAGELPTNLRDLLLARYERLDEPVQYFLRVVAAGGVSVPHPQALGAYDRAAADFDSAARGALHANLLHLDGSCYAFGHALLREAIHADLLPGERTRFHTRYAEVMEDGATTRRDSAEIAYHWHAANVPEKSFGASIAAMGDAECSYAYSTAARMGERALDLWDRVADAEGVAGMPRFALMGRTASAHNLAGDGERSLAMIRLAVADGGATGPALAKLLADQSRYLAFNAQTGSVPLLLRALELTPPGSDEDLRASLLNRLAARYMLEADLGLAVEVATEALELSTAIGNPAERSVASNLRGVTRIMSGDVSGGREDIEAAEALAEGDADALLRFRVNYSDILHLMGLYDESIRVAEDGIESARALGVERTTGALLSSNAVEPLFARGDWARAGELLTRILALSPPRAFHGYLLRSRIFSLLWGGDLPSVEAVLNRWRPLLRKLAGVESQSSLPFMALAGEQAWVRGDLDGAWHEVSSILGKDFKSLPGYDLPLLAVVARILAARRAAGLATADDAEPRMRELLANCSFWPTFAGWSALFEAELGGPGGDGSEPALWKHALTVADTLPAHLRLYISLRTGQAEYGAGNRQLATEALRAARDGAETLGAGLLVGMARDFAQRSGLVLDGRNTRPNDDSLTGREAQVLALVAEGLTNKQIGEQLFISGKTVSVHVSAIMRKLGAASRTEAAAHALKQN